MSLEKLKSYENESKQIPVIKQKNIELGFFSQSRNAYIDIFAEGCNQRFDLDQDGLAYEFSKPVLVTNLKTESASEYGIKIKYEAVLLGEDEFRQLTKVTESDDSPLSSCEVNEFVTAIRISSNKDGFIFLSERVRKVQVEILSPTDWTKIPKIVETYLSLKKRFGAELALQISDLEKRELELSGRIETHTNEIATQKSQMENERAAHTTKLSELKATIEEHEAQQETIEEAIQKAEELKSALALEFNALDEKTKKTEERAAELKSHLETIEQKVSDRENELQLKSQEVAKLNSELQRLHGDVSLFADDMAGFARQGDAQNRKYLLLLGAIIFLAFALSWNSIRSTAELFATYIAAPQLGVGSLIGLKVFHLAFVGVIFHFLYKFSKPFVTEIMAVNRKRLRLSEITMLARDISDSALYGAEVSQDDKLRFRMATRMTLIREHLSGKLEKPIVANEPEEPVLERTVQTPTLALQKPAPKAAVNTGVEGNA